MNRNQVVLSAGALLLAALALGSLAFSVGGAPKPQANPYSGPGPAAPAPGDASKAPAVELKPEELDQFKILPATERVFDIQREAIGSIEFNQERSVDVFPPVQGKVLKLFASAGDDVVEGAPLYTIDSPDLVQAASNLISASGVHELTTRALDRAKKLQDVQGISQKDFDQATSDQQAAEAAVRAARDAVRIFGKTDRDMDAIVTQRKIDPELVVRCPMTARVTARNAAPGLLAQPGSAPSPYTLSDVSTMWMLADVAENDFGLLRLGQAVEVAVKAYPGRIFHGEIVNIGASIDAATRRVSVRSEIRDPQHELRAGMFATFVIKMGQLRSLAVPRGGVIREGDGTVCVWVTADRKSMIRRSTKTGLEQDGFVQILDGLSPGELVATESALFLSNAIESTPQ